MHVIRRRTDFRDTVCVRNEGYLASLELRKLYRVLPDAVARKRGLVRIVDESGEDYLYPEEFFIWVRLPQSAKQAVLMAS
jgi:hypothetical protein